ncbi:MAG: hypothetical protein EA360_00235 [Balneolaceae bacterium]|nr:MAG: hypothetical protein EA360_00235 [Balneolaceae bacterium]
MWEFLKRVFTEKKEGVTLVLLDENEPDMATSFRLRSKDMILVMLVVAAFSVFLSGLIFFFTPLNSVYQRKLDDNFRSEVIAISERVNALQDSLLARDMQLDDLKSFVRDVPDTLFDVRGDLIANISQPASRFYRGSAPVYAYEMLTPDEIQNFMRTGSGRQFPGLFPVEGALTQHFSRESGHLGIDIAAPSGREFRAIAGGMVVNTSWTINYGLMIYVQHRDGIMSIYKHAEQLNKSKGDFVLKGQTLGRVGHRGVLSSGSHLHLEIWKNGIPQDPLHFLI